jgi:hypothetical protein
MTSGPRFARCDFARRMAPVVLAAAAVAGAPAVRSADADASDRCSTVSVDSADALNRELRSAHQCETILLEPGEYAGVIVSGVNVDGTVTIESKDPAHWAQLDNFNINSSSGLTFSHVELAASGPPNFYAFRVDGSKNIQFQKVRVHGPLSSAPAATPNGFGMGGNDTIGITNSEFQHLGRGVVIGYDNNVTISGNDFHDIRTDGIDGASSSNVRVTNNHFTDFYPAPRDHPDAIQFWTVGAKESAHDIVITNNTIERGVGDPIQGIFFKDTGGRFPFVNLTIADNTLTGTGYNGIGIRGAKNLHMSGNKLKSYVGSTQRSWIRLETVDGGEIKHNAAVAFIHTNTSNLAESDNEINEASDPPPKKP